MRCPDRTIPDQLKTSCIKCEDFEKPLIHYEQKSVEQAYGNNVVLYQTKKAICIKSTCYGNVRKFSDVHGNCMDCPEFKVVNE